MKAYFVRLFTLLALSLASVRGFSQYTEENAQANRLSPHKAS